MSSLDDILRLAATHLDRHESWPSELRLDAPRFHALAREVVADDFERICVHLRLRVRQTPGASVGGRSVIQLAEAEAPPARAKERAELWLDVRAAEHPGPPAFSDAFYPRLTQWGLRGDPHLWNELRRRFAGKPIPTTDDETAAIVLYAVAEIIGSDLRGASEHVAVPSLAIGSGMSDGFVHRDFWLGNGVPLIVERAAALRRSW